MTDLTNIRLKLERMMWAAWKSPPEVREKRLLSVAARARRAGVDAAEASTLQLLHTGYESVGDQASMNAIRARLDVLWPRVLPEMWAVLELESAMKKRVATARDLEGALSISFSAGQILAAARARSVTRLRRLSSLRSAALRARRMHDAFIIDLFMLGELARRGDRRAFERMRKEIRDLEHHADVGPHLRKPISEEIESRFDPLIVPNHPRSRRSSRRSAPGRRRR